MIESYGNVVAESLEFMQNLCNKLEGAEGNENSLENFDLGKFWVSLNSVVQRISTDVTKLSLILSKPPYPTAGELSSLLQPIQMQHNQLSSLFFTLPKELGLVLRSEVTTAVTRITKATYDFIKYLGQFTSQRNCQEQLLRLTGVVWEAREDIGKLPVDNRAAVLQILEAEEDLVLDALDEIQEVVSSEKESREIGGDIELIWNNEELELVQECVSLVKTSRALCQKLKTSVQNHGKCQTGHQAMQLDDISESIKKLSPAVDDFISSMYPPCSINNIRSNAVALSNVMESLLNQAKNSHFVPQEEQQWVNFLSLATTHNCNKVQPSTTNDSYSPLIILKDLSLK
ncbi:cyclin-D1-binding protein 1 homolog [Lycorma delicatula]|uniref:cyclin-D1-binding protein 1 homolog n=1 Tax=Lycorma delicatula TaxID=130591 RepID=UPI003F51A52E